MRTLFTPIVYAWILNPAASLAPPALRAVLPDVQAVHSDRYYVYVESAGLSLQSPGPLQAGERDLPAGARHFVFRLPLTPQQSDHPSKTPLGVTGVFRNGVPIYNPTSPVSWQDQNLWHLDAVAESAKPGLAIPPLPDTALLGYALDGFPIYARRFRSGYRLRAITRRTILPDGTGLTPSQEGPPVDERNPLGTFVEDYEYVPNSGDLDEHNGRFTGGTYAYYLSTYPYLIGPTYFGEVPRPDQPTDPTQTVTAGRVELTAPASPQAGQPATLTLSVRDHKGRRIRFLEKVHEQPIHLVVVSSDLSEFAHIHPILQPDDTYSVTYSFPRGGTYWLYADHTPPGGPPTIVKFAINVHGAATPGVAPHAEVPVKLTLPRELRAGKDLTFSFAVLADGLEPWLGAWAHILIVSADGSEFIHAHPAEAATSPQHSHTPAGPGPSTITTTTGFTKPGIYKLWFQIQRHGDVETAPFTFRVEPAPPRPVGEQTIPNGAIRVLVANTGFSPDRIALEAGKPATLAFHRVDARSCANTVVFPELGIRKPLPPGETTLIAIPASTATELHFACGMNMYRGSLVIR